MERLCYFCRKPLAIEKRAEMFCGLRCQQLYGKLRRKPPKSPPGSDSGSVPEKSAPKRLPQPIRQRGG